eukprot:scaffold27103_cov79-Skeletonema_dohrnii-CCMP3373.AAC.3
MSVRMVPCNEWLRFIKLKYGHNLVLHSKPHHLNAGSTAKFGVLAENELSQNRPSTQTAETGLF